MQLEDDAEYVDYVTARLQALRRAAYLLCGDGHRADDLVQVTVIALYRHWKRARVADSIDAYAHRVLVRAFLAERRLRWARVRLMSEPPERIAPPPAGVEERELLRTALGQLSRAQRTVLVLRFACDLSVDEVAGIMRCSPGTVKTHTSRGLAALRRVLDLDQTSPSDR
jgi:RNA polymerase sigma-70 factor (sigma-E family)